MPSASPPDARPLVDAILLGAVHRRASDVHLEPTAEGYEVRYRVDGLLATVARHDAATGRSIVGRLMVLAHLLTYRLDVPQEGRVSFVLPVAGGAAKPHAAGDSAGDSGGLLAGVPASLDLRLSVIPTTHGLRAAVRLPAELTQPRQLDDLGLPGGVLDGLKRFAAADAGMLLVTGPAGAGKTTTIYALLGHIVATNPGVSVVALEDPVERDVPGVTQIQVQPFGELTYERTLRSMLRQDPQVLMLGEIRDAATASLAVQAALSGHRLVCTLHAATCGGAVARLLEMGLEPYQITSALFGVVAQRLLRRAAPPPPPPPGEADAGDRDGADANPARSHGRAPVAEIVRLDDAARTAILARADASTLQAVFASQPGYQPMREVAGEMLARGEIDPGEARRVLVGGGGGA